MGGINVFMELAQVPKYRSNVGDGLNAADYYRVNVYIQLLDTIVSERPGMVHTSDNHLH